LSIVHKMRKNSLFYAFIFLQLSLVFNKAQAFKMFDVDEELDYNKSWYDKKRSDEENFKKLIAVVSRSASGKFILEKATAKAREHGFTLTDVLAVGDGSLTDTTLVRRFKADNPANVAYETKSKVYINKHLKLLDGALDLAHELTHFTYRETFNPYDSKFKLKDFIKSTVEGRGGEVDAYLVECKVLNEILPSELKLRSSCSRVYDFKTGIISKEKGIEEFYKVGSHYSDLLKDFDKFSLTPTELPKITNDEAIFISSAWGLPYPVAAVKEYQNIMDRVCKNDQNRISILQSKVERVPADESSKIFQSKWPEIFEDYKKRCQFFNKNS
jgi:hypothetical protein